MNKKHEGFPIGARRYAPWWWEEPRQFVGTPPKRRALPPWAKLPFYLLGGVAWLAVLGLIGYIIEWLVEVW